MENKQKVNYVKGIILNSLKGFEKRNVMHADILVDYIFANLFSDFQNKINGRGIEPAPTTQYLQSSFLKLDIKKEIIKIKIGHRIKLIFHLLISGIILFLQVLKPTSSKNRNRNRKILIISGFSWHQMESSNLSIIGLEKMVKNFLIDQNVGDFDQIILDTRHFPRKIKSSDFTLASNPIHVIFANLSFMNKLRIFGSVLISISKYLGTSFFSRSILVNSKLIDLQIISMVLKVSKLKLTLLTTQSELLAPPPLFYSKIPSIEKKLALWYSDNNIDVTEITESSLDFDYRYMKIDLLDSAYVWSSAFANLISRFWSVEVVKISPVVLIERPLVRDCLPSSQSKLKVVFFGVSPSVATRNKSINGIQNALLDLNAFSEVASDMDCAERDKFSFQVKVKRSYLPKHHHAEYFNKLKDLHDQGVLEVIFSRNESTALRIILDSDLVVCTPFSSAGLIAKEFGVKSVYFTSTNSYQLPRRYEDLEVVVGAQRLKTLLLSLVKQVRPNGS